MCHLYPKMIPNRQQISENEIQIDAEAEIEYEEDGGIDDNIGDTTMKNNI